MGWKGWGGVGGSQINSRGDFPDNEMVFTPAYMTC